MIKETPPREIIEHIKKRVEEFDLPSYSQDIRTKNYNEDEKIRYNKSYLKFRAFYNKQEKKNLLDLYTLTFFSFCNLIRFNSKNEFNMPFGNRCFIDEHIPVIEKAHQTLNANNIILSNNNAFNILSSITNNENQFIYCDPPYTNTTAIYNESRAFGGWTIEDDLKLFSELDRLNDLGIKWALSNVLQSKGKTNNHIKEWADKKGYEIVYLEDKEYASLGKGNANAIEILVINYESPYKKYNIFDFL